MKANRIVPVIAIFFVLSAAHAMADELWLKNGDHITGKVVRMENSMLLFTTSYAGEVSIKWEEITNIRTDKPIKVLLGDGSAAHGIVTPGEKGSARVKAAQIREPFTIDLAQVTVINPSPPKPPAPAIKLKGRANVGVSITSGNTDTKTFYGDAEAVARSKQNRFTIGGLYNNAEDHNVTTVKNATGYMKYDHFLTEKWYLYANLTGTKDQFKDLNLRSAAGLGVGYQFLETPLTNLLLEAGVSYVNEDFTVAEDESYPAGRWAVNFDHYLFQKRLQFFHFHEGLIGLESADDMFIRSQTGLRFPIYTNFNATAQLNWDWDKSPTPGSEKSDKNYIFTLGYAW